MFFKKINLIPPFLLSIFLDAAVSTIISSPVFTKDFSKEREENYLRNLSNEGKISEGNKMFQTRTNLEVNYKSTNSNDNFIGKLIANKNNEKDIPFNLDIESDIQYQNGNKFYAEGDVSVFLSNAKLSGDKLTFDQSKKELLVEGNIKFRKGKQYFEATSLSYNFESGEGLINNIYGNLDVENFKVDSGLDLQIDEINEDSINQKSTLDNVQLESTTSFGLENTFEDKRKFNITDLNFEIPKITKWRFKARKLKIEKDRLISKKIFFTNDPFNKPQFKLISNNFIVQLNDEKIELTSKNTWVNLDDKFVFPIGRRNIIDRDPISRWTIGSDYQDKDGFYISRSFSPITIFKNSELTFTPYILLQRSINGYSKSSVKKGSSILSEKVRNENTFFDMFALNTDFSSKINDWALNLNIISNSLDLERLHDTSRIDFTINRTLKLNKKTEATQEINENSENEIEFSNLLDTKLYGVFRRNVSRAFSGDAEIYTGKGITLSNRRIWTSAKTLKELSINYDLGEYDAEVLLDKDLAKLRRNVFTVSYNYQFPIWEKQNLDSEFNNSYKYYPKIVKQGIIWETDIDSGLFFYSDDSSQKAISFNTGPSITLGSFKKKFFNYTNLDIKQIYVLKEGSSAFKFDDINSDHKLELNLDQQIYGPLLFSYENYLNLENGKFDKASYGLDFRRRAYEVGAFYNSSSNAFGIKFKIFNFGYDGLNSSF